MKEINYYGIDTIKIRIYHDWTDPIAIYKDSIVFDYFSMEEAVESYRLDDENFNGNYDNYVLNNKEVVENIVSDLIFASYEYWQGFKGKWNNLDDDEKDELLKDYDYSLVKNKYVVEFNQFLKCKVDSDCYYTIGNTKKIKNLLDEENPTIELTNIEW